MRTRESHVLMQCSIKRERHAPNETTHLPELWRELRTSVSLLRKASRRKDHDDDDPRPAAECARRTARSKERDPLRAYDHRRDRPDGERCPVRALSADAQRLS